MSKTKTKTDLVDALEGVLGSIDTEEAAAQAVEAVCQALGWYPDRDCWNYLAEELERREVCGETVSGPHPVEISRA